MTDSRGGSLTRRRIPLRAPAVAAVALLTALVIAAAPVDAEEDFVTGSGRADARLVRVGPAAGQLALAPSVALSLSDFLGTLGRGEARVAEYAALDGSVPEEWKAETPDVRVESTEENSEAGKSQTFMGTPSEVPIVLGAMEQRASAAKTPRGSSQVRLGAFSIPGVIDMSGGVASTWAGVIDKKTREAGGRATIGSLSLGGGRVVMNGLTWEAIQRTGEGAGLFGFFKVEGLKIEGNAVTVPNDGTQLAAVLPAINAALAETGLVIDPPTVAKTGEIARATPLGIRIVNSPLGSKTVAPVIGDVQPYRQQITDPLIENCPECSPLVLVADVAAGVVSGGGRFDLEIGGANGYTEGHKFESPFDFDFTGAFDSGASNDFASFDSGSETFEDIGTASGPSVLGSSPSSFGGSTTGGSAATPPPAATANGGGSESTGTLAGTVKTIPGTRGGTAVLVGLVGLLGALAIGAADLRTIRSSRRTIAG
ncbi:MAG TPA: hypothetical protein VF230_08580 [Acidimicrobiales bacterium]